MDKWRQYVISRGVWANEPVPLYPYPGSPDYTRLWGKPDDNAWERAHPCDAELRAPASDARGRLKPFSGKASQFRQEPAPLLW